MIRNFDKGLIKPASISLRIAGLHQLASKKPLRPGELPSALPLPLPYTLRPGEYLIAESEEEFDIPSTVAILHLHRTAATRMGLQVIGGFGDPGYRGKIYFGIHNLGGNAGRDRERHVFVEDHRLPGGRADHPAPLALHGRQACMTVLGYAKLVELLTGSDEYAFEGHMVALGRNGLTPFRFAALQALARKRRATVSGVLAAIGEPQGGGSYRAVADFFENLHAERLLSKEAVGRRTYWSFAAQHAQFAAFLERCIPPTARRRSS